MPALKPVLAKAAVPLNRKPLAPLSVAAEKVAGKPLVVPNTTYAAPELFPFGSACQAPTTRSSIPSAFMSPAEVTQTPRLSPAAAPVMRKPFVPFSEDRLRLAANPAVDP